VKTSLATLLAFLLAGCGLLTPRVASRPPLSDEGAVFLYLGSWPQDAERLSFTIASLAALRADGVAVPLELALSDLPGADAQRQRLFASGRLPPGPYRGLQLTVSRARVLAPDGPADLLVGKEPVPVDAPFEVKAGAATVLALTPRYEPSVEGGVAFSPRFAVVPPSRPPPSLDGVCANSGGSDLTLFDRRRHEVFGVLPTGREPQGLALAPAPSARLYVALAGEDEVAVRDLTSDLELPRLRLSPGDRPREVAVSPDGRTLLVLNGGSNTLAFLDAASGVERGRVGTGVSPVSLLVDRSWRRAYVLNEGSNTVTVVDLANRAVAGTIQTDAGPIRAQLNRAGDRLYVIHSASPQLEVYALPGLTSAGRVMVGLGASALKVDPRTDLLYVARRDERRLYVYDAFSLIPVDFFDVPGGVSWLAIDDAENAMLALVPSQRLVAVLDLASRRLLGTIAVGDEPYAVAVEGERF
jgi:YVTN family beta-propeller protein